jgi:hypothetical protein
VELCVNNGEFQSPAYGIAFAMGQLYHKVLTQLNACALMFCWTLLNVVQPSYGWTRTLFVPDPEHGFRPAASSHQLRVFGAFSRRVREGMWRVKAVSGNPDLLATTFLGAGGKRTLILLNRSVREQKVNIDWLGAAFENVETVGAFRENSVKSWSGGTQVSIASGAIVTMKNVEVGRGFRTSLSLTPPPPSPAAVRKTHPYTTPRSVRASWHRPDRYKSGRTTARSSCPSALCRPWLDYALRPWCRFHSQVLLLGRFGGSCSLLE